MFASMVSPLYGLGSEPIVMAQMGAFFAMLLVYWNRFGDNFCVKICAVFLMLFLVFVVCLLLSSTASMYTRRLMANKIMYPDVYAWIGGYLTGFFNSMWMLPPAE